MGYSQGKEIGNAWGSEGEIEEEAFQKDVDQPYFCKVNRLRNLGSIFQEKTSTLFESLTKGSSVQTATMVAENSENPTKYMQEPKATQTG